MNNLSIAAVEIDHQSVCWCLDSEANHVQRPQIELLQKSSSNEVRTNRLLNQLPGVPHEKVWPLIRKSDPSSNYPGSTLWNTLA